MVFIITCSVIDRDLLQLAYRQKHSTETALISALGAGSSAILLLLDLSPVGHNRSRYHAGTIM